jgi:AsmA protein
MRKWFIVAGIAVMVLFAAGLAAVLNINSLIEGNKAYLLDRAEQALGRKISVSEVEATLFSGIGARLKNFAMADDPAYATSGDFVRAKDLQIHVKFWPLLKKEVQVKRVVLHDPVIRIIRNPDGKFNFSTIGKKDKEMKEAVEKEKKERAPREENQSTFLVSLVDISGGDVSYIDKKDGTDLQLRRIDLKVEDFDFNQPFKIKLAAAVYADKQNVEFTSKIGPLRSDGDFNQVPLDGEIDVDSLDIGQLKAALPKLRDALPRNLDLSGVYRVKNLKFKGTLKDLGTSGELEGTNGAMLYGKAFQKATGIPLTLTTDAHYAGNKLSIRKGRFKLHTLELAAVGDVQFGDSTVLNLSVKSEPASLDGWENILPAIAKYQLTGTMDVQATVRGKVGKGAAPQIQGTLNLKKASAKPPDFPKPIENLDTKINFTGQRADIGDLSLRMGKSRIRLVAAIEKFSPLTLTYKMSTPEIWPADYQASLSEERKADVIRNFQSDGQFTMAGGNMAYQGKLSSANGTLYNVTYQGLDATLSLADKVANIRSLRVNALSGAVQVVGEYSFKEPVPKFSITSKTQGIDVKELYSALDPKAERDLRGRMNADMKLAGSGKSWEEIKPTLRGQGEAEVLHGALLNFNIAENTLTGITGLPGMTNIINPSLRNKYPETFTAKDTEFKELKAIFDLADGRMNVKDLRMSAAEFVMQGNGWADFTRRVDFRSTLSFSQRLSADLSQSAREMKYLLNNQGQLEMPIALKGKLPNVKPKPDTKYLAQMAQRGFMRKGSDELQNRFLGRRESATPEEDAPADNKKKKRTSTEDRIRKGLEGLFKR